MILIVGLGNPGKKFQKTPHNIGFRAVEEFAKENNFSNFRFSKKFNAEISEGEINNQKVVLAKPQTFMNNSGKTVKKLIENWKLKIKNLFVVHDDLDLPLGKIRISIGRGSAGHKGVQSIIEELKTQDFVRFRIGIKQQKIESRKQKIEDFVLQKFNKDEEKIIEETVKKNCRAIRTAIEKGIERVMTEFNK